MFDLISKDIDETNKFVQQQSTVIQSMSDQISQMIKHKSVLEIQGSILASDDYVRGSA